MKRFFFVVSLLTVLTSCDKDILHGGALSKIQFVQIGYDSDNSDIAERFDGRVESQAFIAFMDSKTIAEGKQQAVESFGDMKFAPGRYPYPKENAGKGKLRVKILPEDAVVRSVSVVSTNPDVLTVTGVDGMDVFIECKGLGETMLNVSVDGPYNSIENEFPISITSVCEMEFYITPYWLGGLFTRLYARPEKLPFVSPNTDIPLSYTDSVSVCGVCEFYSWNERTERLDKHVARDTIRVPAESHVSLFMSSRKNFLRNVSGAVRELCNKTIPGKTRMSVGGQEFIVDSDYHFVVESVILDFLVYGADPYIDFNFTTRCDKVVKSYEYDDDGQPIDSDTDGNVPYQEREERPLVEHESPYFVIRLNDFLSQDERDSRAKEFAGHLKEIGYSQDGLSTDEKDKALEELDKHKKEGE